MGGKYMEQNKGAPVQSGMQFTKEQVEIIKNTIAKGATEDELKIFLYLSSQYNLDPFKKEIWFTKYGSTTNIMTSRDGYLKYAQTNSEFEGIISFVVKEGDDFTIDAGNYQVYHKFGTKRGRILGAWARCDRKGKRPFLAYVDFLEYRKDSSIWNQYPSAMIQKVAEVFVLKRAFGISGLLTREEMEGDTIELSSDETGEVASEEHEADAPATRSQVSQIWKTAREKGLDEESLRAFSLQVTGKSSSKEMTEEEAGMLIKALEEHSGEKREEVPSPPNVLLHKQTGVDITP